MPHPIGKIIASDSHILYHARIYDQSDLPHPPATTDYAFGAFVSIVTNEHTVGVIANSRLLNPDSGHYGPRLTIPHSQNALFAPDYLNEVGVLVSILLLGQIFPTYGYQGIPPTVLPVGSEVQTLDDDALLRFHQDIHGRFQMRYYPLLSASGPAFFAALTDAICQRLTLFADPSSRRILATLRKNVAWQSSLGLMR